MTNRIFTPSDLFAMRRAAVNVGLLATAVDSGNFEDVGDEFTGPVFIRTLAPLSEIIDGIKEIGNG